MKMELRNSQVSLNSDGDLVVSGYVNKPGTLSEVLGSVKKFRERIQPGAFKRALQNRSQEIDFLAEHDPKQVLASTRNDSLTIREDVDGLYMEARMTNTSYGKDYFILIKDKLISSMSFGFRSLKDSWSLENGVNIRTVEELELYEISAVKNPAYTQSSIAARNIDLVEDIDVPTLEQSKTERGNSNMEMKMEKRTNSEERFADYIRGEVRDLNTTSTGAAVIPTSVADIIVMKMEEVSPAFKQAKRFPTVNGDLRIPVENDNITAGFFGEGEAILTKDMTLDSITLKQKRVGAAIQLTQQLVNEQSIDINAYASDLLGRRTGKRIEQSIFTGDGVEEFKGILLEDGIVEVQSTGVITYDDLLELHTSIHPEFIDGAAFYMSRNFFNGISKLKDAIGHYYMQNGVVNGKLTYTLFGSPVYVTDALTEEAPVVFANMEAAYSIMVKKDLALTSVANDTESALRGTRLLVLDAYMDGAVYNKQAVSKLVVNA